MPELKRITVVNDNPEFLQLMQDVLQDASYPATLVSGDRDNATDLIEASDPEILIIDLRLGREGMKGLDILRWTRDHPTLRRVPAIVCTADSWGVEEVRADLNDMGNVTVLMKPFAVQDLYDLLAQAAEA
jgi:CheY-like chemotaxis protein